MARDANVKVVLSANDQASGPLRNFQNSLRGVKTEMGDANDVAGMLKGGIAGIAAAAGVDALVGLAQGAMELGRAGEQALILREAFDQTAAGVGAASASMLASLKTASGGMIADTDLMLAANRAMMLGVADSSEEMAQLLDVAAVRGRAMGLSTSQAFNDLVTGLGRMSPLILDNLGIVTGGEAVFTAYAASIGKAASALTDAERKQALFNKVVASTDTSGGVLVSQFERMDAAIQNAKTALGELFGPAVAVIAQQLADSVNAAMGAVENPAVMTQLADLRKELQDATTEWINLKRAQEELSNLPFTSGNAGFAEGRESWDGPAQIPAPDTSKIDAAKKKMDELGESVQDLEAKIKLYASGMGELDPKLDRIREKQAEAAATGRTFAEIERLVAESAGIMAGALDRAGGAVDAIRGKLVAAAAAGMGASAALAAFDAAKGVEQQAEQIRAGLGNLGFYEPEDISFYVDVNTARAQKQVDDLIGGFNEVESTIESVTSLTAGLLNNMGFDEALKWQSEQQVLLREQADTLREQGYTDQQIAQYLRANVMETQAWAGALDKVDSATSDIEKSFNDLKGLVEGALSEAISLDVTWPGKEGGPDDNREINENARRMAAIANEGLIGQPWLDDLAAEAPAAYADLMLKIAAGMDPKGAAQSIMADFQAGLRPDLLNLDALKEDIKNQIAGEAAMEATAMQITADLVADTGGDSADIQAKVNKALGLGVKSSELTDGIVGQLNSATFNSQLNTAAAAGGKGWGNTFLAVVEQNVPAQLIGLLVNLVTPGVQSNLATQGSLTGPTE